MSTNKPTDEKTTTEPRHKPTDDATDVTMESRTEPAGRIPSAHDESAAATNNQLTWRSRRGMLELELILLPFVRSRLHELTAVDRETYARLLEHDDWDIFEWLQGRLEPDDETLLPILDEIRLANTP